MTTEKVTLNPTTWVKFYADELFGYALAKTGKQELAQDLVQDTFLAALNALANFNAKCSERTWLYSILKNKIVDHFRKASTRLEVNHTKLGGDENDSFLDNFFNEDGEWLSHAKPVDWSTDHSTQIESKEFQSIFHKCLNKLQAIGSAIIHQKWIEEKESEEICKELNLTSSNYWVCMHRAKLQLRACIDKNWFKA